MITNDNYKKCCNCEYWIRKNFLHSPESFKETFKVGDKVSAWCTHKVVVISAIGKYRFFAIDEDKIDLDTKNTRVNNIEHPYSMFNTWRLVNDNKGNDRKES